MSHRLDIVGDVHGQLAALLNLGRHLGYDVDNGWRHPDNRTLVFVGDLVDRGPSSLEVSELVMRLVEDDRAICLMGNHEYNLVTWDFDPEKRTKPSNKKTIEHIRAHPERWRRVLDFFRTLPVAIDLPDLRIIHAVWHLDHVVRAQVPASAPSDPTTPTWLRRHVAITSPFDTTTPTTYETLLKGHETKVPAPYVDVDGKTRHEARASWWSDNSDFIPRDKPTVFGHYWNLPPIQGHSAFAPPYRSGHPDLLKWQQAHAARVPAAGFAEVPENELFVCIDYNGVVSGAPKSGACVGAYQWPERRVAWAKG